MKRKFWFDSVFTRLMLTFLIILIPLYVIGVNVYSWAVDTVRGQLMDSMVSQVNFSISSFELEMQRIQKSMYECTSDENLSQLVFVPVNNLYERNQRIIRLQQHLTYIKNSSRYIDNVYVFIPLIGKKLNAVTFPDNLDTDEFNKYAQLKTTLNGKLINESGHMYFYFRSRSNIDNSSKPAYIFIIALSSAEMKKALLELNTDGTNAFLVKDTSGNYFGISNSNTGTDKDIQNKVTEYLEKDDHHIFQYYRGEKTYLVSYSNSDFLNMALMEYIPEFQVFQPLKKYQELFLIFILVALAAIILYTIYTYKFIHKPMIKLVNSFQKVEKGNFDISITHNHNDEFKYLYRRFNAMVENLKTLVDQVYKQKILAQHAELKQLQSQINPHFLYNNILTVSNLIKMSDFECAQKLTQHLGKYYQYITKTMVEDVPLQKEMNHMRDYIEIQTIRFQSNLRVEVDELPAGYGNRMVPRLILQPIVENAFKYGLREKMDIGRLRIRIRQYDAVFSIFIEDNGDCLSDGKLEEIRSSLISSDLKFSGASSALINVHRRIRIKFGRNSGLWVTRGEMGGLCVEVRIEWGGAEGGNDRVQLIDRG